MNRQFSIKATRTEKGDVFVDSPRVFVLARPSLASTTEDFYAYFKTNLEYKSDDFYPAEKIVENAGRICYLSFSNPGNKTTEAYVKHLIRQGHESVLEHVAWTLVLTGVSRSFTHQLVRHRVGFSFSQLSQQYVDQRSIRFVIPAEVMTDRGLLPKWRKITLEQRDRYIELMDALNQIPSAYSEKERKRSARSAARSILPNCIESIIAVTANARAWRHFLRIRGSIEGDIEMRRVSSEILATLKKEAPNLFFDFETTSLSDGWPILKKLSFTQDIQA